MVSSSQTIIGLHIKDTFQNDIMVMEKYVFPFHEMHVMLIKLDSEVFPEATLYDLYSVWENLLAHKQTSLTENISSILLIVDSMNMKNEYICSHLEIYRESQSQ